MSVLPIEWIPLIIKEHGSRIKPKPVDLMINKHDRICNFIFESPDERNEFEVEFNKTLQRAIRIFIESQEEDPKKFNRNILLESRSEGNALTFRY